MSAAEADVTSYEDVSMTFGRRNAVETITVHWGVVLLTASLAGLWSWASGERVTFLGMAALGVQVLVAGLVVVLSLDALRTGASFDVTDRWDGPTAVVACLAIVVATDGTGGPMSPLWLAVVVSAVYLATALVYELRFYVAAGLVTLAGPTPTRMAWVFTVGLSVSLPAVYLVVRSVSRALYDEAESIGLSQVELERRVHELSEALRRAAQGDLVTSVATEVDAESAGLGATAMVALAQAFNQTVESLSSLVGQIRSGGELLGGSAQELVVSAQQQAVSASEQSSAVSQTTATIEELAATAAQIAETAESVSRFASETLGFAEQGRTAVYASVSAMDSIASRVDQIAVRALSLGEKGQQIGAILAVIDELADQTNLLALNAAIEAARAGEHGRGFAVVAAEVRKLAERSSESAGQIQALVAQIQAETNATILASEEGAREVATGSALARDVVSSLERISGMVDETTTAAKEISIATQQQRSASDQVVAAMTQVSDVSRQYAVGSKQAAASAAQLNGLAAQLRDSIAAFRTRAADAAAVSTRVGDDRVPFSWGPGERAVVAAAVERVGPVH